MWRSDFDVRADSGYQSYDSQLPTLPAYRAPNPSSLVDLNFNRKAQEEKAYVCFGQGMNSLGLPLIVIPSKAHLEPILQLNNIRYKVIDPAAIEAPVSDNKPVRRELYSGTDDEDLNFLKRKPFEKNWSYSR